MKLSESTYVPVLSWRLGEYQALFRLDDAVKDRIVPLVRIPDVEFDFEKRQSKKTVNDHVLPFVGRYTKKWHKRRAWITLHNSIAVGRMNGGIHVFDHIFEGLREFESQAVPAVQLGCDSDTVAAAARANTIDGHGVGILVRLENLMTAGLLTKVNRLAAVLKASIEETDLIIDLRAPNFLPYDVFATALIAALRRFGDFSILRNLVLVSSAIPESFRVIARGTDEIPRHDWLFYRQLREALPPRMRIPAFGDYTVVHPDFTPRDMRLIKAAGRIVYTTATTWATRKGGAFRDDREQMFGHCNEIIHDPIFHFQGAGYSFGDDFIAKCARHQEGPSSPTMWKCVMINHHITTAADILARTYAPSSLL